MKKRGQVTIFIIIAILIIGGVALFFTFRGTLQRPEVVSPEVAPIANFVQECLDDVSEEVIYRVAEGGGYYYPLNKLSTEDLGIAYYIMGNKNYMPSKQRIEQEISKYVSINVLECTKNFEAFSNYKINQGKIITNAEILEDSIKINMNYPLVILKENSSYRINEFEVEVFTPFGTLYDSVNEYVEEELALSRGGICISCLLNITQKYNVYADIVTTEDGSVIFFFTNQDSYDIDYEKALKYVFANKY